MAVHIAELYDFVLLEILSDDYFNFAVQFIQIIVLDLEQSFDFFDEG